MITRYIEGKQVYDTDWYTTCCPMGHALRETGKSPHPKNVYLIHLSQGTIMRKVCCEPCCTHYLNHPDRIGFVSLNKALSNLKMHLVTSHLTQDPHERREPN